MRFTIAQKSPRGNDRRSQCSGRRAPSGSTLSRSAGRTVDTTISTIWTYQNSKDRMVMHLMYSSSGILENVQYASSNGPRVAKLTVVRARSFQQSGFEHHWFYSGIFHNANVFVATGMKRSRELPEEHDMGEKLDQQEGDGNQGDRRFDCSSKVKTTLSIGRRPLRGHADTAEKTDCASQGMLSHASHLPNSDRHDPQQRLVRMLRVEIQVAVRLLGLYRLSNDNRHWVCRFAVVQLVQPV
ncbi:hypothetical protein VTN00DRAFT_2965 [Thermoascus crustaceus]|uniref:uncharacterized protein n=1 Tax=Thermoascus crustaceus TaxID=5088 RepID=UPI0037448AB0